MQQPLHTVIMPVLNGARHIGDALASALVQLGTDDEMLVIDNGSGDGTPELVAGHTDRRIRLLRAATRGPAAARNVGLGAARGKYLSFMDHDDLWPDQRLSGLLRTLLDTPEANAAHGRMRLLLEIPEATPLSAVNGQHVPSISLMVYLFDRDLLKRVGMMDETMLYGEDTDYLIRLRDAGMRHAAYEGDALIYRRHGGNMTHSREQTSDGMMSVLVRNIARRRAAGKE